LNLYERSSVFDMPFKDIVAVVAASIGTAVAVFNWRATRYRTKLKDDLEIQKRYREETLAVGTSKDEIQDDLLYRALRKKIEKKMNKAYATTGTDWSDIWIALAFAGSSLFSWGFAPLGPLDKPLSLLTGTLAVVFAYQAIKDRGARTYN